jgi:DNA-binding protein H-NS
MKKQRAKKAFFDEIRHSANISLACEKCNLSRQTIYRWRKEDGEFTKAMDEAMEEGDAFMNDMTESALTMRIKGGDTSAIKYRLSKRHPKYMDKPAPNFLPNEADIDMAGLAKSAENNIRKLLEKGDRAMTIWVLERLMPEKYSEETAAGMMQKEKRKQEYDRLIKEAFYDENGELLPFKPSTQKYLEEQERKEDEEKEREKNNPLEPKIGDSLIPP